MASIPRSLLTIQKGQAHLGVDRFINDVKLAQLTGDITTVNLEDAILAALILERVRETPAGRKLLGLAKRKNQHPQYNAKHYLPGAPEANIADRYVAGELSMEQAIDELVELHPAADSETTLPRLLNDLAQDATHRAQRMRLFLDAMNPEGAMMDAESIRAVLDRLSKL